MDLVLTNHISLHKILTDKTGVVWIVVMFLSVWTHSDGTHSLKRIHWWTSDVKLNYSKPVPKRKQTDLYFGMAWGRVHFHQIIELNSFNKCKIFIEYIGIYYLD